ncbi:MAG: VOC family protein [Verrucomicrobiales bacterium]|nr:VOC family protein [Verrucomicrobiales bacterium]
MSETNETQCGKPGRVSWNELISPDPKASAKFYGGLFGWQATPFTPPGAAPGGPPYTLFKTDAEDMGTAGMVQSPQPTMPPLWLPYVMVENVDTSLAKAVELGGKALMEVMSIGGVGRIAVVQDPLGAVFGLHEPPKAEV